MVPESDDVNPRLPQHKGPLLVVQYGCILIVLPTVQFNYHCCFVAVEIEDVRPVRMLPPELEASQLAASEQHPEELLRIGLVSAEGAGILQESFWDAMGHKAPSPRPSPPEGARESLLELGEVEEVAFSHLFQLYQLRLSPLALRERGGGEGGSSYRTSPYILSISAFSCSSLCIAA